MKIEIATQAARESLFSQRAELFKNTLTSEQYIQRNYALYEHPFGQKRMQTRILRNQAGKAIASFDALQVRIAMKVAGKEIENRDGFLIASVMTPVEERTRGYASKLLGDFFSENSEAPMVLYSDIEPKFYAKWGFHERQAFAVQSTMDKTAVPEKFERVSSEEFAIHAQETRALLLKECANAGFLNLDPELMDWHLERYRVFARVAGKAFPETSAYEGYHGGETHFIAAAPHFLNAKLEVLWVDSRCAACLRMAHFIADSFGMKTIFYWTTTEPTGGVFKRENPMIYLPHIDRPQYVDPQYFDSW